VKKATCRSDETDWAVKIIDKTKLDKEDEEALKVEVEILQRVDHPNIVSLRQVYDCPKVFYMVMELMTGGELFDRIVEKEKYTEAEARAVVYKLAKAIKYCHDLGIVHRDLKVSLGNGDAVWRLCGKLETWLVCGSFLGCSGHCHPISSAQRALPSFDPPSTPSWCLRDQFRLFCCCSAARELVVHIQS
jgi:serine/threonine protein kinase